MTSLTASQICTPAGVLQAPQGRDYLHARRTGMVDVVTSVKFRSKGHLAVHRY